MVGVSVDAQARAACVQNGEVWLARQQGGIAVYDSRSRQRLHELPVPVNGKAMSQIRCLSSVHNDVWATTADGELLCVDAKTHKTVASLRLPGAEKKAALPDIGFVPIGEGGAGLVTVASATGRVFLVHPSTRRIVASLSTYSPCTAVAQCFQSLVVAGDADGALYAWDLTTAAAGTPVVPGEGEGAVLWAAGLKPTFVNQASSSKVLAVLFEPETQTLWAARENGNLDVYAITSTKNMDGFLLERRADSVGRVTGMTAVSGKVVATTFERKIVTLNAQSGAVMSVESGAHKSFIHGIVKVTRVETAQLWSLGNDEAVRQWFLEGVECPASRPSRLSAEKQAALASAPLTNFFSENARLGTAAEGARVAAATATEELRKARDEAQELRLRVMKLEESVDVKDREVTAKTARVKELEEANEKLTKDVTDITSKVSIGERERTALQSDLGRARDEASQARTDAANRSVEKSKSDEEASRQKTEKLQMEQRLRDAESKIASILAENARLCQSIGNVATAQSAEKEVQNRILQSSVQTNQELQDARNLNRVLSSVVASMEYTIRRKEEEEKDIVALLNAYRRKVADHVTDPFLSALLVATMVRRPERFDIDCDEATKSALLDRNGPFIQFVHSLRQTDPEAYEKLMGYLQQCASASGDQAISAESRQLLDKFVSLAAQEGTLGDDAIQALKRSIPSTVSAASPTGGVTGVGALPQGSAAAFGGVGAADGAGNAVPTAATAATETTAAPYPNLSSIPFPGATTAVDGKNDKDFVGASLLRELRSQRAMEDSYVKEHRAMFEFILKTRRALVECLALLQKRTMSAQQVVEALSANAAVGGSNGAIPKASDALQSPSKSARLVSLQNVFLGIVRELAELTSSVVSQYLTNSEKQRLNVQG